jgi:hypothetical protein
MNRRTFCACSNATRCRDTCSALALPRTRSKNFYVRTNRSPGWYKASDITNKEVGENNPESGSWTGEVCGFWGAGQGSTTRNGATAKGGAVPSEGRCDPAAGCVRHETRSRHPCGPSASALGGAPFQEVATQRCTTKTVQFTPKQPHLKDERQIIRNIVTNHDINLLNERSTTRI